jgi:hypothetical protein
MHTYNFNKLQTNIINKFKMNINTKNYHQIFSLNYIVNLHI